MTENKIVRNFDDEINELDINEKFPGRNGENDFTTYLIKPEILEIMRKKFGLKLENPVPLDIIGNFELDVSFCDRKEIIENQLGKSDHKHRGQVSTYGFKGNSTDIIWFAQEFTQDYIDEFIELNSIYEGKRRFHLAIPKIYKIDDIEYIKFIKIVDPTNLDNDADTEENNIEIEERANILKKLIDDTKLELGEDWNTQNSGRYSAIFKNTWVEASPHRANKNLSSIHYEFNISKIGEIEISIDAEVAKGENRDTINNELRKTEIKNYRGMRLSNDNNLYKIKSSKEEAVINMIKLINNTSKYIDEAINNTFR